MAVFRWTLFLCFLAASPLVQSDEIAIELGELDAALDEALAGGDPLSRFLTDKIQAALADAGLQLEQGRLLLRERVEDLELDGGCTDTRLREMDLDIALNAGTTFSLAFDTLVDPIVLTTAIDAGVDAQGEVRQRFGVVVFGSCSRYGQDTFSFEIDGPVALTLGVSIALNPQASVDGITITPGFTVTGELVSHDLRVDVDDSIVEGELEDYIEDEIEALLSGDNLRNVLQGVEDDLHQAVVDSWGTPGRTFTLPDLDETQIAKLLDLAAGGAAFPVALDYIDDNRLQILLALLTGDSDALEQLVVSAAACEASSLLLVEAGSEPLYTRQGQACARADLAQAGVADYFTDPDCLQDLAYQPTVYAEFCARALTPGQLGDAQDLEGQPPHWTLTPGTRFGVSVLPIAANRQPFMTRIGYKQIGDCHLEMRIYKRRPHETGLRPLLAFHGGSWKTRAAAFYALEAQVSHLTERGFVVFAPFYRLVGTDDGTTQCNGASGQDVVADAADALSWVLDHGAGYGADDTPPALVGQSAGGHLAGWLAMHRAATVRRALLIYPPTDLGDLLAQVDAGAYQNPQGIRAVDDFLGQPLATVDPASLWVADNSFPSLVAADPAAFPASFILQGLADDLVPARQAIRLCNAYAGSPDTGPAGDPDPNRLRNEFDCGPLGSRLHLLTEAGHGLDVCVADALCPAGGEESKALAADSLLVAMDWLAAAAPDEPPQTVSAEAPDAATGTSRFGPIALMLLLLFLVTRGVVIKRR